MNLIRYLLAICCLAVAVPALSATNLTFSGGPATYDTAGQKFGSGALTGVGGRQNVGVAIPTAGTITVGLWVKFTSTPGGSAFAQGGVANGQTISFAFLTDGSVAGFYYNAVAGGTTNIASSTVINDGNWHFLSAALTPSGARFYVDGVQQGTNASAYIPPSAGTQFLDIGHQGSAGSYFTGEIDAVEVWTSDKYTGSSYPVPTAERVGTEANLLALYNLNGNGNDATGSSPPTVTIARTNAALYWSPYTWQDDGTSRIANTGGSYVKFTFTGTSISANLTALSGLSAYPVVRAYVDDNVAVDLQLSSGLTTLPIASGLANGSHTLRLVVRALNFEAGTWTLANAVKITGFTIDNAATVSAPTLRAKVAVVWGDSITEGFRTVRGQSYPTSDDVTLTAWPAIMEALNAEYGQIGYSGTGYETTYNGVPAWPSAYGLYSSGSSRLVSGLLSPAPDYIITAHGTNGTTTQNDVAAMLANLHTIAPGAMVIEVVPPSGFSRAPITAAVNAAIAGGDSKVKLIDAGSGSYQRGLTNGGVENEESSDGLHPLAATNARLAAEWLRQIQAGMSSGGASATFRKGFR